MKIEWMLIEQQNSSTYARFRLTLIFPFAFHSSFSIFLYLFSLPASFSNSNHTFCYLSFFCLSFYLYLCQSTMFLFLSMSRLQYYADFVTKLRIPSLGLKHFFRRGIFIGPNRGPCILEFMPLKVNS